MTTSPGRSVHRNQLRLRHRRPVKSSARYRRPVGSLSPSDSPQPQPIHRSKRRPHRSPNVEWSPHGDDHDLGPPLCKFTDVSLGRIRRYARQAMVEQIPSPRRWIGDRTLRRHQEKPLRLGDASRSYDRLAVLAITFQEFDLLLKLRLRVTLLADTSHSATAILPPQHSIFHRTCAVPQVTGFSPLSMDSVRHSSPYAHPTRLTQHLQNCTASTRVPSRTTFFVCLSLDSGSMVGCDG